MQRSIMWSVMSFTLAAGLVAGPVRGQVAIYSNASVDPTDAGLSTGLVTASGVFAPGSDAWSELQVEGGAANAIAGFSSHLTDGPGPGYRFADDFTVTGSQGWRVQSVLLNAYQVGATAAFPPIAGVNLRIWNGPPGQPGSAVVFGDTGTNRLAELRRSGVYRIFATLAGPSAMPPEQDRQIWQSDVRIGGVRLAPGTYWLDWQYVPSIEGAEIFSPAVTVRNKRSRPGWNALQHIASEDRWAAVVDPGKPASAEDLPQDFSFVLVGWTGCMGDFTGDGRTDFSDYLQFLNFYDSADPMADLTGDGGVDFSDYLEFLNLYTAGCG